MKSYAEKENIEQYVLELIKHYITKVFYTYGRLKYMGIYKDDIESDVAFYIFKTNQNGETFLDKMSKIKTLKHLRAFVKRSVVNQVNSKIREQKSKPIFVRLDYRITEDFDENDSSSNAIDNYDKIEMADINSNTEIEALINTAISSIKNKKYQTYRYEYELGKYKVLDSSDLIWMIVSGKSISAMTESIISVNTGKAIKKAILLKLVLAVREELIESLNSCVDIGEVFRDNYDDRR